MKDNPIRKRRHISYRDGNGNVGMVTIGYWYAICPDCSTELRGGISGKDGKGRKKTKDELHFHRVKYHGGPGGYST